MPTRLRLISVLLAATMFVAVRASGQAVTEWRVPDSPLAKIVYDEGFGSVGSAAFLLDGSVIVGDPLGAKVIIFDSTGRLLRAFGRKGQGPLEFGNLRWARPYGSDSIATYDASQRRVSVIDKTGRFGRSVTIQSSGEGFSPEALAVASDGKIIVRGTRPVASDVPPGVYGLPREVWMYSADGTPVSRIVGGLVGEEWVKVGMPGTLMMRPLASVSLVAVGGGRVYVADSATYPIRVLPAPTGTATRITGNRTVADSKPYVAEHREQQLAEARRGGNQNAIIAMTRLLDGIPYPAHVPTLSRIFVDRDGRLWVQEYPEPAWRRQKFVVYTPAGVLLARVTGPERGRIVDALGDRVLVLSYDADDVAQLQVHRLPR